MAKKHVVGNIINKFKKGNFADDAISGKELNTLRQHIAGGGRVKDEYRSKIDEVVGRTSQGYRRQAEDMGFVNKPGAGKGEVIKGSHAGKARLGRVGKYWAQGAKDHVDGDWGDVAKYVGGKALKGGIAGGAAGGTLEAAQGGSFWEGAKEGAFNGAVGWGAYRGAGMGFSATGKGVKNTFGGAANAFNATSSNRAVVRNAAAGMTGSQRQRMTNVNKDVKALLMNEQNSKNVLK